MTYHANSEFDAKKNPNQADGEAPVAEVLFFFAMWCPVCKTAIPIMNDVKAEYENKTVNGYRLKFTDVDCTQETADVSSLMDQYHIEGFPTIKMIRGDQVYEYDAKVSKETLTMFFNTMLA